jgi:hypothetical protein
MTVPPCAWTGTAAANNTMNRKRTATFAFLICLFLLRREGRGAKWGLRVEALAKM